MEINQKLPSRLISRPITLEGSLEGMQSGAKILQIFFEDDNLLLKLYGMQVKVRNVVERTQIYVLLFRIHQFEMINEANLQPSLTSSIHAKIT